MFTKASRANTGKRRFVARAELLSSKAAAQSAPVSFTESRGLVSRHRHTLEDWPEFAQQPDLLCCHGGNGGTQEGIQILSEGASSGIAGAAWQRRQVARIPASPRPRHEPASKSPVGYSSVASRGVSREARRLQASASAHGTGHRVGHSARRLCLNLGATTAQWENSCGSGNRFKGPVRTTAGDCFRLPPVSVGGGHEVPAWKAEVCEPAGAIADGMAQAGEWLRIAGIREVLRADLGESSTRVRTRLDIRRAGVSGGGSDSP